MEESQEILVRSLQSYGVSFPPNASSVRELPPTSLVSICAQCLNSIHGATSFPTSLASDSISDRVRICTDMASAIKNLGYVGEMNFHKFLYPSEEDFYKLIRFLVGKLSESSESGRNADLGDVRDRKQREDNFRSLLESSVERATIERVNSDNLTIGAKLGDQAPKILNTMAGYASNKHFHEDNLTKRDVLAADDTSSFRMAGFRKDQLTCVTSEKESSEELFHAERIAFGYESAEKDKEDMPVIRQKEVCSTRESSRIRYETNQLLNQAEVLKEDVTARTLEVQHLEKELELLRAAAEVVFDDQHTIDFYQNQLNEQIDAKRHYIMELELEWNAARKHLEGRKGSLEESLCSDIPDIQEGLKEWRELEQERQSILFEIAKRKEEHWKLSAYLKKQPKLLPRKSYIQRIKEITKNSRKQDADIDQILKETRELRLESNSIQERLDRTYAIADELVFREAKKDPTGRQAYRLLTSFHESFERISEKILATDRIRREVTEHEMKLASMASRRSSIDKLQADLDAIRRENEYLEQKLQNK